MQTSPQPRHEARDRRTLPGMDARAGKLAGAVMAATLPSGARLQGWVALVASTGWVQAPARKMLWSGVCAARGTSVLSRCALWTWLRFRWRARHYTVIPILLPAKRGVLLALAAKNERARSIALCLWCVRALVAPIARHTWPAC